MSILSSTFSPDTRKAFLEMTSEADYREALPHRTAGLERTALIQCMDTGAVGD